MGVEILTKQDLEQSNREIIQALENTIKKELKQDCTQESDWMTRKEAAEYLGVTYPTLKSYVEKGYIKRYEMPGTGKPRFSRKNIDEAIKETNPIKYK